jgi:hypothetical protein
LRTLLAVYAETRVGKRVETLVGDVLAAVVTLAERLGRAVQTAKGLIEMPEETTFLARKQERFLTLHGVGALICHVERVRAQVSISALRCRAESLVVMSELLQHALPLLE